MKEGINEWQDLTLKGERYLTLCARYFIHSPFTRVYIVHGYTRHCFCWQGRKSISFSRRDIRKKVVKSMNNLDCEPPCPSPTHFLPSVLIYKATYSPVFHDITHIPNSQTSNLIIRHSHLYQSCGWSMTEKMSLSEGRVHPRTPKSLFENIGLRVVGQWGGVFGGREETPFCPALVSQVNLFTFLLWTWSNINITGRQMRPRGKDTSLPLVVRPYPPLCQKWRPNKRQEPLQSTSPTVDVGMLLYIYYRLWSLSPHTWSSAHHAGYRSLPALELNTQDSLISMPYDYPLYSTMHSHNWTLQHSVEQPLWKRGRQDIFWWRWEQIYRWTYIYTHQHSPKLVLE